MRRREFITFVGGAAAVLPRIAHAQSGRMRRVALLMGNPEGDPRAQVNLTALREGLRKLDWIEGHNIQIDYRLAGGGPERARTFARELIGMAPDVIVCSSNQVTEILLHETSTIPIVFVFVGDPVGSGFVASLGPAVTPLVSPITRTRSEVSGPRYSTRLHRKSTVPGSSSIQTHHPMSGSSARQKRPHPHLR
jgi:ABC transporter substrate binding protein